MIRPDPRAPLPSGSSSPSTVIGPAATEGPRIVDSLDDMLERAKAGPGPGSPGLGGLTADAETSISRTILSRSLADAAAGHGPDPGAAAAAAATTATTAPGVGRTAVLEPCHRSPEDDVDTLTRTYRQLFRHHLRPRAAAGASKGRTRQPSR